MKLVKITAENRKKWQVGVARLENMSIYPLGTDSFRINHGQDYFAFFDRLGNAHYYAWVQQNEVVAVACGVLRNLPQKAWYLCDLKVHPDYRGRRLPLKMLTRVFWYQYLRCGRGYGISMNKPNENGNKVFRLLSQFRWLPFHVGTLLDIYSLDSQGMTQCQPLLEKSWGKIGYLSLAGKKDIVLQSTGKSLPLLHLQHGPTATYQFDSAQIGFTHMFCLPQSHTLSVDLKKLGITPQASATLVHHRMHHWNWDFVLTSDI